MSSWTSFMELIQHCGGGGVALISRVAFDRFQTSLTEEERPAEGAAVGSSARRRVTRERQHDWLEGAFQKVFCIWGKGRRPALAGGLVEKRAEHMLEC